MIIYEAQISEFLDDVANEVIVDRLYNVYQEKIGRTSKSEIRSWDHSLQRMSNVLRDHAIPKDAKAAIEFKIPNKGKRVDFIIAGNDGNEDHAIIIELKQWESVEKNDRFRRGSDGNLFRRGETSNNPPILSGLELCSIN